MSEHFTIDGTYEPIIIVANTAPVEDATLQQLGVELHDFTRFEHDYQNGGVRKEIHKYDGQIDTVTVADQHHGPAVTLTNNTDWELPNAARYFSPGTITHARQLMGLRTAYLQDYLEIMDEDRSWTNPGLGGRAMNAVESARIAGLPLEAVPERVRQLAREGAESYARQALEHSQEGEGYLAKRELTLAYRTMSDLEEPFAFEGSTWQVDSLSDASFQMQNNLTRGIWGRPNTKKEREKVEAATYLAESIVRESGEEIAFNEYVQEATHLEVPMLAVAGKK